MTAPPPRVVALARTCSSVALVAVLATGCVPAGPGAAPPEAAPGSTGPTSSASPTGPGTTTGTSPARPAAEPPDVPVVSATLAPPEPAPPAPRRLVVAGLDIDMPVEPMGVDADGQMALPEDAGRVGWYRFGSRPGSPAGTTTLAAHVDSWASGIGPFARLRGIDVGADVTLTTADGTVHAYRVTDVQKVAKERAPLDQVFDRDGAPRLVLVTCGGSFRRDIGHYTDNVIVTAEPVAG